MMIDFHTHTLLSDGALLPSELLNRAAAMGYRGLAITDHADSSNLKTLLAQICSFSPMEGGGGSKVRFVPGVELTHMAPGEVESLTKEARRLGARVVVCHGESVVEPVPAGTNMAAIEARVDILAHPGLVTDEECALARENSVLFEITSRRGHCLANGHVAAMARKHGVGLIINSDAHGPGDLMSEEFAATVAAGASMTKDELDRAKKNSEELLERTTS